MDAGLKVILKQSLPIFTLCSIGGVAAGVILNGITLDLRLIPGIIILLPAILGMRGNISGALGSRIASALHLGLINPELKWNKTLSRNIKASLILNTLMSVLSGFLAYTAYTFIISPGGSPASLPQLVLISFFSGSLAGVIISLLTVSLALLTYSKGYDPDNILAPSLATIGDIITVLCLLFSIKVVSFII